MYYISMYFGRQCREFYLAQEGTWNHSLTIAQESSGLSYDIVMPIRALEGKCFLSAPSGMQWEGSGKEKEIALQNGQTLRLTGGSIGISIVVFEIQKEATIMTKYRLPLNMPIRIGRNEECAISQDSNIMTSVHGELAAISERECFYTDHSRNGTYINGVKIVNQRVTLAYGDVITAGFGLKIVYLGDLLAINNPPALRHNRLHKAPPLPIVQYDIKKAIEEDKTSAVVWYHRSPRMLNMENSEAVTIEPPLARDNSNLPPMWMTIGPSATMVVPMLLSAMVGGRGNMAPMLAMMGGSAAMAVMWGLINANYRKKHGAEMEAKRNEVYRQYITDMENRLLSLTEQEQARLNEQCFTVAQCLTLPASNTHRLWERMPQHADFTILRLGTGRVPLPNPIAIQEERLQLEPDPLGKEPARLKETYEYMNGAPITLRLREWQIVGILGSMDHPHLMQSLVAQLAATHSYHDVVISILAQPNHRSQWEWARWLPHVFADEDRTMRLTAFTPAAVQAVAEHLSDVLMIRDERMGEKTKNEEEETLPLPHYVVFCTDPALMENHPLMRRIMSRKLGFTLIMLAESMEQLPKECGVIVHANERLGAVYSAQGEITNVQYEAADLPALQRFGRQIAPLRVKDATESSFIPSMVTFMEIYHARNVEDIDVWRFWNENHAYDGLRSTIGLRSGAQPFVLDISERYHGPHGLVAGTTGSGKSVMLQTYILSLALNYHPEEVQFILIDYKGGGMANVFTDLPHVAGIIDNLQGQRTISRALLSIQGEIKRREEIFKRLGVEKIDEYIRYYNHDPNERPLAHLIIVVDEFAELKKEQPDFMRELVSTARVGRSVGLHMILATQKPSNSVDDEIWSNTKFRICLRVATRADSNDMLKRPDAAYLKGMGRCYVQVGNDEIFEQVQTSFSGAEYAPLSLVGDEVPRMLDDAGRPMKIKKPAPKKNTSVKPQTQMDVVLKRIRQVMEEHHLQPTQPLWMREVEPIVLLENLPEFRDQCFDGQNWKTNADLSTEFRVYYGIVDDVRMQRHLPLYADFLQEHNIKILAPSGAGKTTLIQTMVLSAAMAYSPEQVNMYIFSLTSRTLGALAHLPHVGEVVFENEDAEIVQLLNLLIDESNRRAKLFSQRMTDSFAQYNLAADHSDGAFKRLPAILVFADRFKHLMEKLDEGKLRQLYDLVRSAAGRGIFFVVTAIALTNEELGRVSDYFTGLAIQQEDRSAYKEAIGATGMITADEADVRAYPGRGLVWYDNGVHGAAACEMQCAIYASHVDAERAERVEQLAQRMSAAWKGAAPRGIIRIPEMLTSSVFFDILEKSGAKPEAGMLPIGLDKENGAPCTILLDKTPSLLVCGGVRSGRTNTILAMADMLVRTGAEVHLFGEDALLTRYAQAHGDAVRYHSLEDEKPLVEFFTKELNPVMAQRKQALVGAESSGPAAQWQVTQSLKPIVLMFDDYDQFTKVMYGQNEILGWMQKINRVMAGRRLHFILSMSHRAVNRSTTNEFVQDVAKSGTGLALCGMLSEADPWGVGNVNNRRLKYPVGEGLFIQNGQLSYVVLPQYE